MQQKSVLMTLGWMLLIVTVAVTPVIAQPRIVGVNVGDWYKYGEIEVNWSSNNPNVTIPFNNFNETEWMMMSVTNITGTNVTGQMTWHFINGTEETQGGYIDVDTGESAEATMWLISADLNANDTVYSSGNWSSMRINETIFRTYPDSPRTTNHLNITYAYEMMGFYTYMSMNYYWDKATGVLVEMSQEYNQTIGLLSTSGFLSIRITESSSWIIPEFSPWTTILVFLSLVPIAFIYKRRRVKTPTH